MNWVVWLGKKIFIKIKPCNWRSCSSTILSVSADHFKFTLKYLLLRLISLLSAVKRQSVCLPGHLLIFLTLSTGLCSLTAQQSSTPLYTSQALGDESNYSCSAPSIFISFINPKYCSSSRLAGSPLRKSRRSLAIANERPVVRSLCLSLSFMLSL